MISLCIMKIDGISFGVAIDEEKIVSASFSFNEEKVLRNLLGSVPYDVPFQQQEKVSPLAERVITLLKDIYDGKDGSSRFSLVTEHLSSYARKVIEAVYLVPVGYVTSYGSVAEAVGGSPRAVGRVMASNPFPLIVPCHRVVRSDFKPGGYGGSHSEVGVKLEILRRESRGYTSKRIIPVDGKKLSIFPVEFVLKRLEKDKC